MSQIFDPGMQPERTALAWRRTGLSMVVGSLAAFRIFPDILGPFAFVAAGAAFALAVTVLVAAQLRYRRHHTMLMAKRDPEPGAQPEPGAGRRHARPPLSGGILVTITAAAVLGLGTCGAIALLLR